MKNPMITDEQLRREDRPAEQVAKALKAGTIIRLTAVQTGQKFTRMGDALVAYELNRKRQEQGQ